MENRSDQSGQRPQHAEDPDQGVLPADLDQIGLEQRHPGRWKVGVDLDGRGVGDVVDGEEFVNQAGHVESSAEGRDEHGLDRVEAILRLIEGDAGG